MGIPLGTFDLLVDQILLYLLVFARIFALLQSAPLLSSQSVPAIARIGLAGFTALVVLPSQIAIADPIPDTGGQYLLLLVGEVLLGILSGFFLVLIFAAFQTAGQLFSLQLGFGASQVFDPLAQVEIPLVGQFFNIVAMLIFISASGFQELFLVGVMRSFDALRVVDLIGGNEIIAMTMLEGLIRLFQNALVISFPVMGTLFVVTLTTGLLGKAAPQMNLLILGFPISIGVAFLILLLTLPILVNVMSAIIDASFDRLLDLFGDIGTTERVLGRPVP